MTRFASAPWPLKAAYVGVLGVGAATLLTALALGVALAGLKRLSPHLDAAAVPAWFWYFRADPQVRRWLGIGLGLAMVSCLALVLGIARNLRPRCSAQRAGPARANWPGPDCGQNRASCWAGRPAVPWCSAGRSMCCFMRRPAPARASAW